MREGKVDLNRFISETIQSDARYSSQSTRSRTRANIDSLFNDASPGVEAHFHA
jgi:hypothetical protein